MVLPIVQEALSIRTEAMLVFDFTLLQSGFSKVVAALAALSADHEKLVREVQSMQKENQDLKANMSLQISDLRDLVERTAMKIGTQDMIERIADRVNTMENRMTQFALTSEVIDFTPDIVRLQQSVRAAEEGLEALKESNTDLGSQLRQQKNDLGKITGDISQERTERRKVVQDVDADLQVVRKTVEQLNTETRGIQQNKANKSDLGTIEQLCERCMKAMHETEAANAVMKAAIDGFNKMLEEKLRAKADVVDVNDKLGRVECEEFLQGLAARLGVEMQKTSRMTAEMREELDFVLTNMLHKQTQASGMMKCISCAKVVPNVHKPGAVPRTGRNPVLVMGDDNKFYKRRESLPDTASEVEQFTYTPHWPRTSNLLHKRDGSPPRTLDLSGSEPRPPMRPKSAHTTASPRQPA